MSPQNLPAFNCGGNPLKAHAGNLSEEKNKHKGPLSIYLH